MSGVGAVLSGCAPYPMGSDRHLTVVSGLNYMVRYPAGALKSEGLPDLEARGIESNMIYKQRQHRVQ